MSNYLETAINSKCSLGQETRETLFDDFNFYTDTDPLTVKVCESTSSFEEVNFLEYTFTPERALLCAVLQRAYLDLYSNVERHITRDAIRWFTVEEGTEDLIEMEDDSISYAFIAQTLDLTDKDHKKIKDMIHLAEKR